MSEKIRHNLIGYEVPPPAGSWDKLANALHEQDVYRPLAERLTAHTEVPAATNWDKIAATLTEQSLTGKLLNHEEQPPIGSWEKISNIISGKPSAVRRLPWRNYAAAAILIPAFVLGLYAILFRQETGTQVSGQTEAADSAVQPLQAQSGTALQEIVHPAGTDTMSNDNRNAAALEASKKSMARLDIRPGKLTADIGGFYFAGSPETAGADVLNALQEPASSSLADRYITLITPEGNIIRVSKKLGGMVCCISGSDGDADCNDQLKKWREKLISSPLGHSADNFLELLDLVNSTEQDPI